MKDCWGVGGSVMIPKDEFADSISLISLEVFQP